MTEGEQVAVCVRDAIAEALHRTQDLGLSAECMAKVRELIVDMVTFHDKKRERALELLTAMLDDPHGKLNRDIS